MAHTPVADEANGKRAMLNDGFDGGQKGFIIGSVDKLHRRFTDFHFQTPFHTKV